MVGSCGEVGLTGHLTSDLDVAGSSPPAATRHIMLCAVG